MCACGGSALEDGSVIKQQDKTLFVYTPKAPRVTLPFDPKESQVKFAFSGLVVAF